MSHLVVCVSLQLSLMVSSCVHISDIHLVLASLHALQAEKQSWLMELSETSSMVTEKEREIRKLREEKVQVEGNERK
jgi:hypothetical protein